MGYVKRLTVACNTGQDFPHKSAHDCEFGKSLYGEVIPRLDDMPENIRQAVLEIEGLHTDFHTKAGHIARSCEKSDINDLHTITDFLVIRLTRLEKVAKQQPQLEPPA